MDGSAAPKLSLVELGWSDALARAMPETPSVYPARVAAVHGMRADVWTPDGLRRAMFRGRSRRVMMEGGLVIGDWVAVGDVAGDEAEVVIEHVLPRRSAFVRAAAGERPVPQAIAANVDRVFIVTSLDGDWSPRRLERYLAASVGSGAEAVIVIGKADLPFDTTEAVRVASELAPTLVVSARTGLGVDALRSHMPVGSTSVFVGSSGVGKSALVNYLLGRAVQTEGAVREHDRRGRHTTTRRDLFVIPEGGLLVDTPGMREFKPWEGDATEPADGRRSGTERGRRRPRPK